MKLTVLFLLAQLAPCYSDKPENCPNPVPRSEQPAPRIIFGPTIIVPDDGKLHPYNNADGWAIPSCQSPGAICQKTA